MMSLQEQYFQACLDWEPATETETETEPETKSGVEGVAVTSFTVILSLATGLLMK